MGMSLLSYCLQFDFGRRECSCSRRRPTVPKLLSLIIICNLCLSKVLFLFALVHYVVGTLKKSEIAICTYNLDSRRSFNLFFSQRCSLCA